MNIFFAILGLLLVGFIIYKILKWYPNPWFVFLLCLFLSGCATRKAHWSTLPLNGPDILEINGK
jgi:hypothetical protein